MKKKELILSLIKQDMRHNRLFYCLESVGMELDDGHNLNILSIVARSMGIPKHQTSDQWGAIYSSFMEQAQQLPITPQGKEFDKLACQCYEQLDACIKIEKQLLN